jgi:hypothetical protein
MDIGLAGVYVTALVGLFLLLRPKRPPEDKP